MSTADEIQMKMAAAQPTVDRIINVLTDAATLMNAQAVEYAGRWMFIHPRALKMIRKVLNRKPLAKRPGPRGRRLALKRRRAQR